MTDLQKVNYLTVGNKKVPVEIKEVDIFDLSYYTQNPRINYAMGMSDDPSDQNKIEEALWKMESTRRLTEEIRSNGGLMEEVWVLKGQVIEGNRRLCAIRHIYKSSPPEQQGNWKRIRAKVLLADLDEKGVFLILGNLHIKGKVPWDPYEKASYIHKMISENQMDMVAVSNIVGMSQGEIKNQLKAYELMRDAYLPKLNEFQKLDEPGQLKKFSIFQEYFNGSDLQNIAREHPEILSDEKFVNWVLEERIKSAAYDVKKDLPKILNSKKARKVFVESPKEDAIQAAKEALYEDRPETGDTFLGKIKKMTDYVKNLKVLEIREKVKDTPRAQDLIKNFHTEVEKFYRDLGIRDPNKEYIKRLRKNS
jgi:hypothetical protein